MGKSPKLAVALRLAEQHRLYLFPMRFIDGRKVPAIKGWPDKATMDPEQLEKWFGSGDLNIGVATGASGLIVLDTDQKGVDGDANLRALLGAAAHFLDETFTVESPTGSRHYYFRADLVRNSVGLLAPAVDVRSRGGYVVAPGSISDKGTYRVIRNLPIASIPQVLIDAVAQAYTQAERVELTAVVELDTPTIQATALQYLSTVEPAIEGEGGNDQTYKVACRLKDLGMSADGALDAMDLYSDWNARCVPPWDRDELAEVIEHAYSYGENSPGSAAIDLEFDIIPDDLVVEPEAEAEEKQRDKIVFLTDDEIKSGKGKRREYIIKGVLAKGDLAAIIGHPGVGKSLLAPYLGRRVATGDLAFGRRTRKGGVFYVAVEDPTGMTERVEALQTVLGMAPGFELVCGISNLAAKGSPDLKVLLEAVKARRPVLTFIDTLAMAFPGIDENSAEGMGRVLAIGKMLAKHGTAVVYIHHDTKTGGDSGRGHGSFDGALDMRLYLTRSEGSDIISGKQGKNRNGPSDWTPAFRIGVSPLGIDEDGDEITAAYAKEVAGGEAKPRSRLPASVQGALDVLNDLGGVGIDRRAWRDACCNDVSKMSTADDVKSRQQAFRRALQELLQRGLIEIKGTRVSAAGAAEDLGEPFPDEAIET